MQLSIDDFPAFFAAVNGGRAPFPWQSRLAADAATLMAGGGRDILPTLVDLPTGAGKTSLIDVVTFLQALDSARPADQRVVPRRIVFVVDRRVVVDQVDEHVRHLAEQLRLGLSGSGVLGDVGRALMQLHGSDREPPLKTGTLRGGIERDETWARRPDVATVITSTVDQVGSRLLFRGYGVSDSVKPIQAGLLGADTLIVLDEVHLSMPFAETLHMLADRYIGAGQVAMPRRWAVVELSATARQKLGRTVFRLGPEDRDPATAPALWARLTAAKPTRLAEVAVNINDDAKFAGIVTHHVREVMAGGDHRRVLVVCNRVARAAACAEALTRATQGRQPGALRSAQVELLTGRMRAVEREAVLARVAPVVASGASPLERPLVVVSTQSIEVGADFDFDALVTECASVDALRQRFGRVNRLGTCVDRGMSARGVVLCRTAETKPGFCDPIYGDALGATWRALLSRASSDQSTGELTIDFGAGFPTELAEDPGLLPVRDNAPFLFPQHLDAWSQTHPIPVPDPDPALWLHGLEPSDPDVSVVWRADVTAQRLARARDDGDALASLVDSLAVIPPGPSETISVPVSHVRAWLTGQPAVALGDADAAPVEIDVSHGAMREVLAWRGESTLVVGPGRIRPGDVVVVPATYGGISELGTWDPRSTAPVRDEAEVDQVGPIRRRPVLRINQDVLGLDVPEAVDEESSTATARRIRDFLDAAAGSLSAHGWPEARKWTVDYLRQKSVRFKLARDGTGWIVTSLSRVARPGADSTSLVDESSEGSSFAAVQVTLEAHTTGVADTAQSIARHCGLPEFLVADVALAAALHDVGKLDPRFQAMLAFPDATIPEPLGKSRHGNDRRLRAKARSMSGLPGGFDHAVAGLAILEAHPQLLHAAHDPDLVVHLIASHHGQCRPFARPVAGAHAVAIQAMWRATMIDVPALTTDPVFDLDLAERFFELRRRYGWYGLAHLEAIVRLADWYQSGREQSAGGV